LTYSSVAAIKNSSPCFDQQITQIFRIAVFFEGLREKLCSLYPAALHAIQLGHVVDLLSFNKTLWLGGEGDKSGWLPLP
jgi:hypothetical protein